MNFLLDHPNCLKISIATISTIYMQRQQFTGVLQDSCSNKSSKLYRTALVPESFFNKIKPFFIFENLQHGYSL